MRQEVYFKNIQSKISELLDTASYDIKIAVAWLTDEYLINKLKKLVQDGVSVSIIIFDDNINNKDLFERLYLLDCKIYLSRKLMHNKFCVIDENIVINGSYNWTYSAHTNDENITVTYGNVEFAEKFENEFHKLSEKCSLIDSFFKYSKDNLKRQEVEFDLFFKKNKLNDKYPYFKKIKDLKKREIHRSKKVKTGHVLIENEITEYNFFRYFYFLEKNYNFNEIEKHSSILFVTPIVHSNIINISNIDENIYADKNIYIVEKRIENEEYGDVYSINNKGEIITKKLRFANKLDNGFYKINPYYGKTEIYDDLLNKINFDGTFVNLIDFVGVISYKYIDSKYKYGLTDFNNKVLVSFIFDYFFIADKQVVHFYEYSMLYSKYDSYYDKITIQYRNGNFSATKPEIDTVYKIHVYSHIDKSLKLFDKIYNQKENIDYYFKSDNNYMFLEFYEECGAFITAEDFKKAKEKVQQNFLYFTNNSFERRRYAKTLNSIYNHKLISVEEQKRINNKKCYIATMVYKDINHPKVQSFRDFRDNYLSKTILGNCFIKHYYKYSPTLVKILMPHKMANKVIRYVLDIILMLIPKK